MRIRENNMRTVISLAVCLLILTFTQNALSQKGKIVSRVCGDPSAACAKRATFKNEDIPFSFVENSVVAETQQFYAVILKSAKASTDQGECTKIPAEFDIDNYQPYFLRNKVFIARGCYEIENNFYKGVKDGTMALAVFAGHTKAEADGFLKKLKAIDYLDSKDAYLLRMSTGFNGT